MKELPSKIKIGGLVYKVFLDKELDIVIDEERYGSCNSRKQVIKIANVHPLKQRATLIHEIVHAIDHSMGLELEENQVCGLEYGLFALFQDNDLSFLSEKAEED